MAAGGIGPVVIGLAVEASSPGRWRRPGMPANAEASAPSRTASSSRGKAASPSPRTTKSTKGKWRWTAAPCSASQLAPPMTVTVPGASGGNKGPEGAACPSVMPDTADTRPARGGTPDPRAAPSPPCRRGTKFPGRWFAIAHRAGDRGPRRALRRRASRSGSAPATGSDVRPHGPVARRSRGRCAAKAGRCLPVARASARPARPGTGRRAAPARRRSRGDAAHRPTTFPVGTRTAIKHSATGPEVASRGGCEAGGPGGPPAERLSAVAHFRVADRP